MALAGDAAIRSLDWKVSEVVAYELETGIRRTVLSGLSNGDGDQGWVGVSPEVLPDGWVLVEWWGVEDTASPSVGGYLLNIETGEVITLAPGTVGWT
jgi:hypothetical protein